MDDEDWSYYRFFLNGEQMAARRGVDRWREPHAMTLEPADEIYGHLVFGGRNVLAVEVAGLHRHRPDMIPGERDHYLFNSWLIDQFITAGVPYAVVNDFEVQDVRADAASPAAWLKVDAVSRGHPEIGVTLSYRASADRPYLRKAVTVHNRSAQSIRLLDVTLEDWTGDFASERGGRGEPLVSGNLFVGGEHPAAVNMGDQNWLKVRQLPGRDIAPGANFDSVSTVVGAATGGQSVEDAFHDYLLGLRPRRRERMTVYSALGWYDFTNPADPLFELNEDLVDENLSVLQALRDRDVSFDVYMLDDWWEPTDLYKLRERTFPHGSVALRKRIQDAGMRPGLWFATTTAPWTADKARGITAAVAGGTGIEPSIAPPADPRKEVGWVEGFTTFHTRMLRLCLAAEPYQTMVRQAIPRHVRELDLACLKFDCATLHCTSSEHAHRPGKYSVEAMMNVMIATAEDALQINPDLVVIWYWGFRSPWWLKYGDLAFDKGLLMEGASPASAPAPSYRQSVSLNVDQAIRHATAIPLAMQDSLGVWVGNVAWANRMGKEGWRDAFLLDVARGSTIIQIWGDVSSFDDSDVAFLADVLKWMRTTGSSFRTAIPVGGDQWRAEAYGYAQRINGGAIVTLYNPSFEDASLRVPVSDLGLDGADHHLVYELYPFPGFVPDAVTTGTVLDIALKPFEVRCLEVLRSPTTPLDLPVQQRPATHATSRLDLSLHEVIQEGVPSLEERSLTTTGSIHLPSIHRGDYITLVARFHRKGDWWYHPEPHSLVRFRGRMRGREVYYEVVPSTRAYNGPGSPWVVYNIPVGVAWTNQELYLDLCATLPHEVSLTIETYLLDEWWVRNEKRFAARL